MRDAVAILMKPDLPLQRVSPLAPTVRGGHLHITTGGVAPLPPALAKERERESQRVILGGQLAGGFDRPLMPWGRRRRVRERKQSR